MLVAIFVRRVYTSGSGTTMTQETVRIIALVLMLALVGVIIMRRRAKKGKVEDDF